MSDTTDTLARPVGSLPPPSGVSVPSPPPTPPTPSGPPGPGQISQAPPLPPTFTPTFTPTLTPPVARVMAPASEPVAMFSPPVVASTRKSSHGGGARRGISWLLLLSVLGGLGYAGVTYGPDLVDSARGADGSDGPAAPLVYPVPTALPDIVRTATFTVSQPDAFGGTEDYEVTADFESGVAQVMIPRADSADLEILSVWDQAFIRSADDTVWYSLPRGEFPVDFTIGRRSRWIRTLDELLPPATRTFTTIDEATDSFVDTLPTRRLVVSADAMRLLDAQTAAAIPTTDGSPQPPAPLPPGITVQAGVDDAEGLTMEIWIDESGIVRKSVMPEQLGGETITVGSVSADAFEPSFPTPDMVQPLTAQALFRLGI